MDFEALRLERVREILENRDTEYARNATEEFKGIKTQVAFRKFLNSILPGQPTRVNNRPMVITLDDLADSINTTGVYDSFSFGPGEEYALDRDLVMSRIVGGIVKHEVKRTNGTLLIPRGGDQLISGHGVNPTYDDLEKNLRRSLIASVRKREALRYRGSFEYRNFIIARMIEQDMKEGRLQSLDDITSDYFYAVGNKVDDLLDEKLKLGRPSDLMVSTGIGVGLNNCTFHKFLGLFGEFDLNTTFVEVNGTGANLAGRVEGVAENDQILVAIDPPLMKELEPDSSLFIVKYLGEMEVKGMKIYPYEIGGVLTFYQDDFFGKLPLDSFVQQNIEFYRSMVKTQYEGRLLKEINAKYRRWNLDVPGMQREDILDHGLALTSAALVAAMCDTTLKMYANVHKNRAISGIDYEGLQFTFDTIKEFSTDDLIMFTLIHKLGKYRLDSEHGIDIHPLRYIMEDEEQNRQEEALDTYTIISRVSEFQNTRMPELCLERYAPFDKVERQYDAKMALAIQLVDMADKWVELVSPRDYSGPIPHKIAFDYMRGEYKDSPWLPMFQTIMGRPPSGYDTSMLKF